MSMDMSSSVIMSSPWFLDINTNFPKNMWIYFRKKQQELLLGCFSTLFNSIYTTFPYSNGNLQSEQSMHLRLFQMKEKLTSELKGIT